MTYIKCLEEESTHVKILDTECNQGLMNSFNIKINDFYEILRNTDRGFEGEEMIKNDDGRYVCSFSIVLDVEWVKLNREMVGQ